MGGGIKTFISNKTCKKDLIVKFEDFQIRDKLRVKMDSICDYGDKLIFLLKFEIYYICMPLTVLGAPFTFFSKKTHAVHAV